MKFNGCLTFLSRDSDDDDDDDDDDADDDQPLCSLFCQ